MQARTTKQGEEACSYPPLNLDTVEGWNCQCFGTWPINGNECLMPFQMPMKREITESTNPRTIMRIAQNRMNRSKISYPWRGGGATLACFHPR
jgi:hypothetical protein